MNQEQSEMALKLRSWVLAPLFLVGVLALLTWANYQFTRENPGGSDFLPAWAGTRAFLTHEVSPYSQAVKLEVQKRFYGHPAAPDQDVILFVYPFYSLIVFAPFALLSDFSVARGLWMVMLEISLVMTALLSLSALRWRPPRFTLATYLVFSILWYFGLRAVINGNVVILVGLFVTSGFWFMKNEKDFAAGLCFALATIKPNIVVLLLPFVLWWAYTRRRWQLISSTLGCIGALVLMSCIVFPSWLIENVAEMLAYSGYPTPTNPSDVFELWWPNIGYQLGWAMTLLMVVILFLEWRAAAGQEYHWFLWTASLTLIITQWIGITTDPGNFVILFFPLSLVLTAWGMSEGRVGMILIIISIVILFFGLWGLFVATLTKTNQPMQNPVLFFPLPLFLLITMFWIRGWAIQPSHLST